MLDFRIILSSNSFLRLKSFYFFRDAVNGTLNNTRRILEKLAVKDYTEDDVNLLRYVCRIVSNRSALLVAICLSVLLERIDNKEVTIAVDGSVYEKHPSYRFQLEKYVRQMTKKKVREIFIFIRGFETRWQGFTPGVIIILPQKHLYCTFCINIKVDMIVLALIAIKII